MITILNFDEIKQISGGILADTSVFILLGISYITALAAKPYITHISPKIAQVIDYLAPISLIIGPIFFITVSILYQYFTRYHLLN